MEQSVINNYTVSETAQQNFKKFSKLLENFFPQKFNLDETELKPRKDCSEVQINLLSQGWLEDLVEDLVKNINVNILYAIAQGSGKDYKVIAYSMPYEDEMYIIQMTSKQYGIIEEMSVAFYDSLDTMFDDVKYQLQLLHFADEEDTEILEQEDPRTTFSHFG